MKHRQFLKLFALLIVCLFLFVPVSAKDEWIMVQSKNFKLIGNAGDKDLRRVATKLEQFREVFRLVFSGINFTSSIPTNVVVFKNGSAYKPFKPKRADGKTDEFVAGFFQPGEDVNYITLSTEGEDARTFEVIFHEYVHFLVNTNIGKSNVLPWFNEGLAEYYSTFAIEDNQKVKLGVFKQNHINLLNGAKLLPLETLFAVSNYELLQQGNHSRSIFYAESWSLIHYFMQNGKSDELGKFLQSLMKGTPPEKAFQDSFQMTYAQMEKQLNSYVAQNSYKYIYLTLKNKLVFDSEMQTTPLSEAQADAYLGDLLFHNHRAEDAEAFLQKSIALDANQSAAYITLGMIRFRQQKFDEAKDYFEKALSDDQKNSLALYYYAYSLMRGNGNGFGFASGFPAETTAKMRDALKKSIVLNPSFAGSYDLLAFVNLVNNESLDEAVQLLRKALAIQPGNQKFAMRIAEIYLRQEKFDDARAIAEKIAKTTDQPEIKLQAENLSASIRQYQENRVRYETSKKQYEDSMKNNAGGQPTLARRNNSDAKTQTPEESAKTEAEENIRAVNRGLRKTPAGEKRILAQIQKIDCKGKNIIYAVKTGDEEFTLFSKDFQALALNTFTTDAENVEIGCDAKVAGLNLVLTYKPQSDAKASTRGELTAIEFVPKNFKLDN
ncbi:MAG: tetratricopeptide repeat protein [Pyrinomonadaceae bacterium]